MHNLFFKPLSTRPKAVGTVSGPDCYAKAARLWESVDRHFKAFFFSLASGRLAWHLPVISTLTMDGLLSDGGVIAVASRAA